MKSDRVNFSHGAQADSKPGTKSVMSSRRLRISTKGEKGAVLLSDVADENCKDR